MCPLGSLGTSDLVPFARIADAHVYVTICRYARMAERQPGHAMRVGSDPRSVVSSGQLTVPGDPAAYLLPPVLMANSLRRLAAMNKASAGT
jgi:hypothetical protein